MVNPNNLCPGCMNEKVTEGRCPLCGYDPQEPQNPVFLKPGSLLDGRYYVGKVLDSNGEGVTYLGLDTVTSTNVNIREFFPQGLCERDENGNVIMLSGSEYDFNNALGKFCELSRTLFKLNELPALFDVLDVREANSTAYRITRAVPGISLREFLMRNGGMLKWDQARSLFAPLVASISALHKAGVIHMGISPDTLIVGKDGKVRLSGFCVEDVRMVKSNLTSQLFPSFAAVEQYGKGGTVGPWTDVYAFAATIYRTLVGNPPPEAIDRIDNDNMTIPAKIARETPRAVLETLANALQVLPEDRTQYIDEMKKGLSVSSAVAEAQTPAKESARPAAQPARREYADERYQSRQPQKNNKKKSKNKLYGVLACIGTVVILAVLIVVILSTFGLKLFGADNDTASNNNSLAAYSATSVASKNGDVESKVSVTALPSFSGRTYHDVSTDSEFIDLYTFKIKSKEYSDTVPAGQIISQSPAAGTAIESGAVVELVVSLGSYYRPMIDVTGLDQDSAIIQLMKAGFSYDNIIVESKYDDTKQPGVIIATDPEKGLSVNLDSKVTIIINDYQGRPVEQESYTKTTSSSTKSTSSTSSKK